MGNLNLKALSLQFNFQGWLRTTALVAVLTVAPGAAWATDYCLTFPATASYILVGRNFFPLPAKGKYKAWVGFTPQNGGNFPSTGTGCTSSDGTNFTVNLTTIEEGTVVIFDSASLTLPAQSGTDGEYIPSIPSTTSGAVTNGAKCNASTHTIPAITAPSESTGSTGDVGLSQQP